MRPTHASDYAKSWLQVAQILPHSFVVILLQLTSCPEAVLAQWWLSSVVVRLRLRFGDNCGHKCPHALWVAWGGL